MAKKLLSFFIFFMLLFYVTAIAKDLSDIALGKQDFTLFRNPQLQILRLLNCLVFYTAAAAGYIIFMKWYGTKGLFKTIVAFIFSIFLVISLRYFLDEVMCPYLFGFRNYPKNVSFTYYYLDTFSFCFYYSVWGLGFFFFDFVRQKEREQQDILLQNRTAELSYLRAQVNPHFLFNSINNIYSLVATKPQAALPVLDQLSNLIRYMLYENDNEVPVKKELKYLMDYIELQKIRYNDPEIVTVNLALESMELNIAPLLLLPFIENIFKHADLINGFTEINISTQLTKLALHTKNKIQAAKASVAPGIGLENVRRRLQLLYPGRHTLTTNTKADQYIVDLMIDLKKVAK